MSVSKMKRVVRQRTIVIRTLWIVLAFATAAGGLLAWFVAGLSGLDPQPRDVRPLVLAGALLIMDSVVIVALVWRAVGYGSGVMNAVGYTFVTFVLVLLVTALASGGIVGFSVVFLALAAPVAAAIAITTWRERRR